MVFVAVRSIEQKQTEVKAGTSARGRVSKIGRRASESRKSPYALMIVPRRVASSYHSPSLFHLYVLAIAHCVSLSLSLSLPLRLTASLYSNRPVAFDRIFARDRKKEAYSCLLALIIIFPKGPLFFSMSTTDHQRRVTPPTSLSLSFSFLRN